MHNTTNKNEYKNYSFRINRSMKLVLSELKKKRKILDVM
jgi:hypothetical protein